LKDRSHGSINPKDLDIANLSTESLPGCADYPAEVIRIGKEQVMIWIKRLSLLISTPVWGRSANHLHCPRWTILCQVVLNYAFAHTNLNLSFSHAADSSVTGNQMNRFFLAKTNPGRFPLMDNLPGPFGL
jgi:hypothetical protein